MSVGDFIFSRITIVFSIIMILSIPAVCIWPLFRVNAGEVSFIIKDTIKEKNGEKFHDVWFEYDGHSENEKYIISSKREMSLYNKLRNGVYMKESPWLELIYIILWCAIAICAVFCWMEGLFTNDLSYFAREELAKFYVRIIKPILKFLGHDSEKVENLKLTIQYNERLSFIGCFTKLVHSLS